MKAEILFVTWDGGGNVPPALGIAAELAARGHRTRFLGHRSQESALRAAGHAFTAYAEAADFVVFTRAPHRLDRSPASDYVRDWEPRTPIGQFARTRDREMIGPAAD